MGFAHIDKSDPDFFYSVGVELHRDISPAAVVVTLFYSPTLLMTVIASKIMQRLANLKCRVSTERFKCAFWLCTHTRLAEVLVKL